MDGNILMSHIAATRARLMANAAITCPDARQRTLVFTTIGGFGDRLRGMVTSYYAALLTHAAFRMSWTAPASIAPYFDIEPTHLWVGSGSGGGAHFTGGETYAPFDAHLAIPGAAATVNIIDVFNFFSDPATDFVAGLAPPANGSVTILRTNAPSWLDIVRHPSVRRAADLYGLTDLSRQDLFVLALQAVLRRPSQVVIDAVSSVLPQPLQTTVYRSLAAGFGKGDPARRQPGASGTRAASYRRDALLGHARTGLGRNLGTTSSERSLPHPCPHWRPDPDRRHRRGLDSEHRHPVESARCFADRARELCLDVYGGACVVFLTADSRAAADAFVGALNGTGIAVAQTRGLVLHTDRGVPASSRNEADTVAKQADPWLKTYADWAALSQVDVLLMSHSGYGLTAAWAGGVPHVRQLRKGGACEWVQLHECADVPI